MLRRVVVFCALSTIGASVPTAIPTVPMLDGRIVGGVSTSIEEFPYQLSLRYYGSHICGASIIGPKAALTAAHCTNGFSPSALSVLAGTSYKSSGGITRNVQSICQHPGYNPTIIDKDVSVLILNSALSYSAAIQPISLPAVNQGIPTGSLATVTGWGTLYSDGPSPNILQKVQVPKVTQDSCKSSYGASLITSNMICFGFASGGKDSCQGDSGGPLVYNGKQVGIVSWGNGCANGRYPGVYANTAAATILNHINSCLL